MPQKVPRLQFTDEELASPVVKKAAEKAACKLEKLEKAENKIPKREQKTKQRVVDSKTGKVTTRLYFEEVDKKPPPSKLTHAAVNAPLDTVRNHMHKQIQSDDDDNAGVEAADRISEAVEETTRVIETAHHSHALKPYEKAKHAEKAADRANVKALGKNFEQAHGFSVNPYSRWQQKRAIKKEYAAAKTGQSAQNTVRASEVTAKSAKRAAAESKKIGTFVSDHPKGLLMIGLIAVLLLIVVSSFSSCSVLFQGIGTSLVSSTYPVADEDLLAAEEQYLAMEATLHQELTDYEHDHDYDEYHFELDEIWHDPYVLVSEITALKGGGWTVDEVGDILDLLFEKQYILTEDVASETRYRTETRTEIHIETDSATGETTPVEHEYEVEVPYTYKICNVSLENFNLSHVPIYIMSEDQLSLYSLYMSTLGNRPDLFPDSPSVLKYYGTDYEKYEIPPEALSDERFAAMIKEAEKYLGFPYVWGGQNPSTSFDCSGYVSWVINHCGVGWNFGRLGAESLYYICTPVSSGNARPGDLIFFERTYDEVGITHVGIYVGDGMMIHCGDPIHYETINSNYWREHFYAFGRLPNP